jgi:hypothetical protein
MKFFLRTLIKRNERQYALRWLFSISNDYLLKKPSPWICFSAIDFISKWIAEKEDIQVFEYGSGGSTLYWLTNGCEVISIEHDASWYKKIREMIPESLKADYRLIEPLYCGSTPEKFFTTDEALKKYSFQSYVTVIDEFPDAYFDIVLVDGRSRPFCIQYAVSKVKEGGMLILDNADIPDYLEIAGKFLVGFDPLIFSGITPTHFWDTQTNVYIRRSLVI